MPEPLDKVARLQRSMENAGLGDFMKIHSRKIDEATGNVTLDITISPDSQEGADLIVKDLTIKPFSSEKDTVTYLGGETRLISVDGQNIRLELIFEHPSQKLVASKSRAIKSKDENGWNR